MSELRSLKISVLLLYITIGLCLLWGLGLFIVCCFFTYPTDEDMWLSAMARDVGFYQAFINLYSIYDGRYTTNILHILNPLSFNSIAGYQYVPFIVILLMVHSASVFVSQLFTYQRLIHSITISALIVLVFLSIIPILNTNLYWAGGAYVYLMPLVFLLYWLAYISDFVRNQTPSNTKFFKATILLILGIGFNEMFLALYTTCLTSLVLIYLIKRKMPKWVLPHVLTGFVCIAFFVLAPGAQLRLQNGGMALSFDLTSQIISHFFSSLTLTFLMPQVFLMLLLIQCLHIHWSVKKRVTLTKKQSFAAILLIVFMTIGMLTVYNVSKNVLGDYPIRIFAPILGIYIFSAILLLPNPLCVSRVRLPFVLLFILALGLNVTLYASENIKSLSGDLTSGRLHQFRQEMFDRTNILFRESNNANYVRVKNLSYIPKSIYANPDSETNQNTSLWNRYYESYFRIARVVTNNDSTYRFNPLTNCND